MSIDWTLTVNTPIMIFIAGVAVGIIQASIKKNRRQHLLTDIKVDSIIHAIFFSLNGSVKETKSEYEKKKNELMKENKFTGE